MCRVNIVVEMIDLRPVIHGLSIFNPYCSQNIMKDSVEPYLAKTEFARDKFELGLAVIPDQRPGIIGAN